MGKGRDGTVPRLFVPVPQTSVPVPGLSGILVPTVPWLWVPVSVPIMGICGTGPGSRHTPGTTYPWLILKWLNFLLFWRDHFVSLWSPLEDEGQTNHFSFLVSNSRSLSKVKLKPKTEFGEVHISRFLGNRPCFWGSKYPRVEGTLALCNYFSTNEYCITKKILGILKLKRFS